MTQETELNKYNKPWVVKKASFNYRTCIDDCDGDWIAQTVINNLSPKGAEDLTKHIVKCVNEYDQLRQAKAELIEALESTHQHCLTIDVHEIYENESADFNEGYTTALEDLMNSEWFKKALEKAKGDR